MLANEPSHSLTFLFNLRRGRFRVRLHQVALSYRRRWRNTWWLTIDCFPFFSLPGVWERQ